MAGFAIPGLEPAALPPLPREVQARIEESVKQFEAMFGPYRMLGSAHIAGWVSEYRGELVSLAYLCLASGGASAGTVPGVGGPR